LQKLVKIGENWKKFPKISPESALKMGFLLDVFMLSCFLPSVTQNYGQNARRKLALAQNQQIGINIFRNFPPKSALICTKTTQSPLAIVFTRVMKKIPQTTA